MGSKEELSGPRPEGRAWLDGPHACESEGYDLSSRETESK